MLYSELNNTERPNGDKFDVYLVIIKDKMTADKMTLQSCKILCLKVLQAAVQWFGV